MLFLKYKKLLFLFSILLAMGGVFGLTAPQNEVFAYHVQCFGLSTIGTDTTACTNQKRDAANRACLAKYEGNNGAITDCVTQVMLHYTAPPDTAPPLPEELESDLGKPKDCKDVNLSSDNCAIVRYLNDAIKILSGIVGIVVTIMIIVGGIQYSVAGADPNAVAKAKKQIFNAIFALVAYGLMFAFLQYLIPGGLL